MTTSINLVFRIYTDNTADFFQDQLNLLEHYVVEVGCRAKGSSQMGESIVQAKALFQNTRPIGTVINEFDKFPKMVKKILIWT